MAGIGYPLSAGTAGWGSVIADRLRSGQLWTATEGDNLQSVISALPNGSPSAPTVLLVMPGFYEGVFSVDRSNVAIIGLDPKNTILWKPAVSNSSVGTLTVGGTTNLHVENVLVRGLGIYNANHGGTGGGQPPEPALQIGNSALGGTWYNNVFVEDCHIIGNHDGFQAFGSVDVGKLWTRNNYVAACHDAYTLKTCGQIYSIGNQIYANDQGVSPLFGNGFPAPFNLDPWKTTGIHFGVVAFAGQDPARDFFLSVGDSIHVVGTQNSYGGTALQRNVAGILWYSNQAPITTRIINPCIVVEYTDNAGNTPAVNGVRFQNVEPCADGTIIIQGGSIDVRQKGVGGTAPTEVACIRNEGSNAALATLRIAGTVLHGSNLFPGQTWGLQTAHANARIFAHCFTPGLINDTAGGGIINAWPTLP